MSQNSVFLILGLKKGYPDAALLVESWVERGGKGREGKDAYSLLQNPVGRYPERRGPVAHLSCCAMTGISIDRFHEQ